MSRRKNVTTIGQISFDELCAIMDAEATTESSSQESTNTIIPRPVLTDWAAMFDYDDDVEDGTVAIELESEVQETKTESLYELMPESEIEDVLNIPERNGTAKVYSPATESVILADEVARIKANVAALNLLDKLETADVYADESQQDTLAAYSGWEHILRSGDKTVKAELNAHFTEDEIEEIMTVPQYPYAASEVVPHAIKKVLNSIGFKSGNILLHGTGNGMLARSLSKKMMKESRVTFDATDETNERITSFLFPKSEVMNSSQAIRDSYYDVAIALAPVSPSGNSVIVGKRGAIELPNFACSMVRVLSAVRNGGVLVLMIESKTVDGMEYIHSPFGLSTAPLNFAGGLRLDKNAFGNGIGYDLLVFNKTEKGQADQRDLLLKSYYNSSSYYKASDYFIFNGDYIIGDGLEENAKTHAVSIKTVPVAMQFTKIDAAVKGWGCKGLYKEVEVDTETEDADSLPAYSNVKNYSMVVIAGRIYQRIDSRMVRQKISGRAAQRVMGMISLRNQARKVIDIQLTECSDEELEREQKKLNGLYDAFVKEFSYITSTTNIRLFREDADVTLLTALEYTDEEDVVHKADIFTKRTIKMRKLITSCDTVQEAYMLCLDHRGRADVGYIADLCEKTEEEVINEIGGVLIFRNPSAGAFDEQWIAADEYLSGKVVEKLAEARWAAEDSTEFEANVKALEKIQPPIIPSDEIQISIGAQFINPKYISQFVYEVIGASGTARLGIGPETFTFPKDAKGVCKFHSKCYIPSAHPGFYSQYGTSDYSAGWVVERLMNKTQIVAMKSEKDPTTGKSIRVKDVSATVILLEKALLLETEFKKWIYADASREADIVQEYNKVYNSTIVAKYDGSHLSFPGMTASIKLKKHQKNAVYRIIRDNGALIGHVVGAGKTITLLAAGMELKRLGRVSKPVYLVPNNLLAQWGGEMMRLYPTANILLAEPDDMRKHRRKRFLARLATGSYDAIILGSSSFTQIPAPVSTVDEYINELSHKLLTKRFPGEEGNVYYRAKAYEVIPQRVKDDKLKTFMTNQSADYTLEELGIDYLFVDEAHDFKNLYSGSGRGQIRGISNTGAAKCSDLYYKTKYLNKLHGGKGGFTFATGTPIVNTIVELYNWQRFYQEDLLIENNILSLDDWLSLFGNVTSVWELPPEGLNEDGEGFRAVTRVSSFKNVPELMKMVLQFLDCVNRDEIDMSTPDIIRKVINCQPSLHQKDYMRQLVERANQIRSRKVRSEVDNMLNVTMDGRKSALDVRIVNPKASDSKHSKVSQCAAEVLKIYNQYSGIRGTQLIFSDISTPNQSGFNVYDAIKEKLISLGIPNDEIAFAHDFKTDKQRTAMRIKMQTGRLRVLIGSTQTVGQGVNIQNRLIALHNIDVPWVPKDIDQREGRIVRPNNMNASVLLYNYVTEGSFDAYMWQTIELKARLISQILRGDFNQRVVEDIDTKVFSYSEIKAIATGDTRFLQRAKLEGKIARLETIKRNHESQKSKLKQDVHKNLPKTIESLKTLIPKIEKDIASLETYGDTNIFTYKGVEYDLSDSKQRSLAVKELPKSTFGLRAGDTFGTYNGMSIVLAEQSSWSSVFATKELTVVLQGNAAHRLDNNTASTGRMILEACRRIANIIPASLDEKKEKLRSNSLALNAAKELLDEPFEQEDRLNQLKKEYEEVSHSLAA